jgi:hypothetical protein
MRRRIPNAAIGALVLLALMVSPFLLGRCAGSATGRAELSESARSWILLALVLAAVLLLRWVWRAVSRTVRRWFGSS